MGFGAPRRDPALGDVVRAGIGLGGLTLCLTLVYLGMRAVMDVGGACADGGPYVSAQSCPDGAPASLMLGMLGLFLFGGIALAYGGRLGGIWAATPVLAWSGLFGSLGWNFLDYGVLNPPPEADGIIWGWLIPGVLFELMAIVPLVAVLASLRSGRRSSGGPTVMIRPRPMRGPALVHATRIAAAGAASSGSADRAAERAGLRAVAADMGTVIAQEAAAATPAAPLAREVALGAVDPADASPGPGFEESTQALLDRLERLGDMRDRGLLTVAEFEAAKATIVAELEARA